MEGGGGGGLPVHLTNLAFLRFYTYLLRYSQKGNMDMNRTHKGVWKALLAFSTNSGSGFT